MLSYARFRHQVKTLAHFSQRLPRGPRPVPGGRATPQAPA
jgi:hypothetical protein